MKLTTTSGNEYWYNPHSNAIEEYDGQVYTQPFVRYLPASVTDALPDLEHFIIEVTRNCNLRCTYCCYSGKYPDHRVHANESMSDSEIESVLSFIEENRNKSSRLTISFYGGEPLLNMSFVQKAITHSKKLFPADTEYTISTNGILLTEENIRFIVENGIVLYVTIDGSPTLHDKNRRSINNQPSFHTVHGNLERLRSHDIEYWFSKVHLLVTIESYSCLRSIAEYWVEDEILKDVAPFSISLVVPNYSYGSAYIDDYTTELLSLLSYYENHRNNMFCRTFFEMFISAIENREIYDMPDTIFPYVCLPHNFKCFIDVKGNTGICEKISDNFRFGNIHTGFDYNKINAIIERHAAVRQSRCTCCWAYRLCQTCYHNLGLSDGVWKVDCENSRSIIACKLRIYLELVERNLLRLKEVPVLQSSRCVLKGINELDIPRLQDIFNDADSQKFLPELYDLMKTDNEVQTFLSSSRNNLRQGTGILWGTYKEDKLIGFVGITELNNNPTIFYAMHPDYRNQGFMKESVEVAIAYLCDSEQCDHIHTEVYKKNKASIAILKSLGFYETNENKKDKTLMRLDIST